MALKKLPGGVIVETETGARLNEDAGINLEAIHRQIVAGVSTELTAAVTSMQELVDQARAEFATVFVSNISQDASNGRFYFSPGSASAALATDGSGRLYARSR